MKKKLLLMIVLIIFILTSISLLLILQYVDPYKYESIAITLFLIASTFSTTSFFLLVIYFIKKIYYRGDIHLFHVLTSLRQAVFISLFFGGIVAFYMFGVLRIGTFSILFFLFLLLELFIQNIGKKG